MKNPFNHENYPSNRIKRNAFPLSFQYNGTFEYGKIYPVGLIRVPNAGTYKIEPTLALNFMPTVFPVQTRQKAYLHFFYGRDRNFWNEYKDFVHGLKPNLVKPYLDESVTQARTGNLLDYLGVPTTIVGNYGSEIESFSLAYEVLNQTFENSVDYSSYSSLDGILEILNSQSTVDVSNTSNSVNSIYLAKYVIDSSKDYDSVSRISVKIGLSNYAGYINDWLNTTFDATFETEWNGSPISVPYFGPGPVEDNKPFRYFSLVFSNDDELTASSEIASIGCIGLRDNGELIFPSSSLFKEYKNVYLRYSLAYGVYYTEAIQRNSTIDIPEGASFISTPLRFYAPTSEVRDIDETTSPYWRSGATIDLRERIKLNAIPCRMYETIYNLYYRNPQNNPYILNGVPEYNIFTPTLDGGVDNNLYQLRYRNWADDFLTTATQTPQQGIAPLVGLTDRGATITLTNEDGSITRYKTTLDDVGNLTGIETTDSSEPILTQALVDAVTYGISIEDIRNVNKMQKWLELNLRKGYQYKDVIEARWGISISYNELNLPEFIGGFTQEVSMQAVTQTANIDDSVTGQLGWQAGRMYCAKDGREITHYCDEAGYIMVLLSVAPMPNYSQLLPKHWFTRDLLEEYQPEFNHIGFQPITYKEVCPVQAFQESTENNNVLEQTFGYQRPWYEYMSMPDEVHGQFRTTLKDYLINRVFNVKPELSESFLLVDPEQINDVFNVTESDDKILGAINYNIVAKLPISEYATATIE